MWSGRIAKARRGGLAVPLPIGFARRPSGEVVLDPDEQVRSVVRLVFDLFERLGTVGAVLGFLADNHIQLGIRLREGPDRGELTWRRPSRAGLTSMLHNPAYAGIYAYGRSTVNPRRRQAGRPFTGRVRQPRGEWAVFLPGALPAYISVEQYERNMQRLDASRSRAQSLGAVRDGPALLAGLVACGRCGKKMTVRYQRGPGGELHPAYVCSRGKSDYAAGQCQQLAGPCVDAHVTDLLLAAMAPPHSRSPWPRPGRPRPSGRRPAGSGGSAWNAPITRWTGPAASTSSPSRKTAWSSGNWRRTGRPPLAERQRLGEEYDRFTAARPRTLTTAERAQIRALAADLPAVWHAPTTTDADRKQLLRHLIEQVRVAVLGTREKVEVEVAWAGGHRTRAQITRPVACLTQLSYYPQLAARARELVDTGYTTAQIAERLNAEGFRPPKRNPAFTPNAVSDLLRVLGIQRSRIPARRNRPSLAGHEWWLRDLAAHLDMSEVTLDAWVRRGWATGYLHPQARLRVVRTDPAEAERLRALHHVPRGQHNRRPWLKNQAALMNIEREGAGNNADEPRL
jgi:hypothetical protein